MRTLVLVMFTAFVLVLGFMGYWWMQDPAKHKVSSKDKGGPNQRLVNRETKDPYGPGKNIWIKKYNEDTGLLASRFKADDYQPRNDGWMVVKQPRAQFFMEDGRAITVEGVTGEVIMDDQGNKQGTKAFSGSRDTPSRGRLQNVTVKLWHDIAVPEEELDDEYVKEHPEKQPALTITLPNAAFDNQTFRIQSEQYTRRGTPIPRDQVPVVLRGEDYDFDGRGLTIRWNERDRRLQLLEVDHGDRLIIKHPSSVMKREQTVAQDDVPADWLAPLPVMLAARGRAATAEAINSAPVATTGPSTRRTPKGAIPKPKIKPNLDPPLYRATFHDNVKVVQGEELSVLGNKMSVDFLMQDQESEAKHPATQPTSRPATTQPTTRVAHKGTRSPSTTQATTRAVTKKNKPATQPDEQAVIITWTGKLVVEPLAVGTETPLKSGDAVVRVEGTPCTATQQGSTILCGTLTYRTEDQAMLLAPMGPNQPVVMKDTKGSLVHTTRMDFFQPKRQAILYGTSDALFPQEDENGKPAAPMLAKWTKACTLYFAPGENGASANNMNIERAELDGNVDVTHPQLKLKSQQLELGFDTTKKATTQPSTQPTTAPSKAAQLASKADALKAALAQIDGKISDTSHVFANNDPAAVIAAKSAALEPLDTNTAQLAKSVKDLQATGKPIPADLQSQFDKTSQQFNAAKGEFEHLQKALLDLQDLRTERDSTARKLSDLNKQIAAMPTTGPSTRPTTRPAIRSDLKSLVATGAVHCEMTDSAKKTQTIDCNRLTLQTTVDPQGRIYPSTVNADGDVHAVDPDQDLRAGHLAVALRPTTKPTKDSGTGGNAELQSMVAHNNVKVISKDGTIATSDQLLIENKDGKNNVKLLGQPFATIIDKKNTLNGPIIEIFPDEQRFEVVGGGNMKGTQQEKAGEAERPLDVTWNRGMTYNGKANSVDVTGQVVAVTIDAEGATNTAKGERVKMTLVDAPTTRPSTQPTTQVAVATTQPTTQPTTKPSKSQYAGMSAKTVRNVQFEQNAQISSVSLADDGSLLRRLHLEAQIVQYDMLAKKMTVPVEGQMLVEDHRPTTQPSTQPATDKTTAEARPAGAGLPGGEGQSNRGSTAFQWSKKFTYDDSTKLAVMTGDLSKPVIVVHQDDKPNAKPYRLTADTVTAEMEEVAVPTTQPAATQPTTKPSRQTKVQMKKVTADGHMVFNGPGAEIHALYMEYDPATGWLIARGTEREPVVFDIATQPGGQKTAEEIQYNLESGLVRGAKITGRKG